jgi:hypothetical protein
VILIVTKTASFGKTLVFPINVIPRQGGRAMMMAQNATDGKLGKVLGAATDLFDYVRQAGGGKAFTSGRGHLAAMLQMT